MDYDPDCDQLTVSTSRHASSSQGEGWSAVSGDDPFAALGETLDDEPDDEEPTPDEGSEASTTQEFPSREPVNRVDSMTDSAFSYDEAKQGPFYARERTIEDSILC